MSWCAVEAVHTGPPLAFAPMQQQPSRRPPAARGPWSARRASRGCRVAPPAALPAVPPPSPSPPSGLTARATDAAAAAIAAALISTAALTAAAALRPRASTSPPLPPPSPFASQVLKELELLEEDAQVFKLIGPVLVKQELVEVKSNVRRRPPPSHAVSAAATPPPPRRLGR